MRAAWTALLLGACVSPVDYAASPDAPPRVDAPDPCMPFGDNEDEDCVGDKPDVCPTVAEETQLDTDGDGVGDACDRQPGAANDIAFFAGFGPLDEPRSWTGANWTIGNGSLIMAVLGGAGDVTPTDPEDELRGPLLVVAALRWIADPDAEAALALDDGSTCFVQTSPDGATTLLGLRGAAPTATAGLPPITDEGQRFSLSLEHVVGDAGPELRCTYANDAGFTATVAHPAAHDRRGRLHVAARNARLLVDSLIAYQLVY